MTFGRRGAVVNWAIFGNTVCDATGLLDANEFPNSQDFNALRPS
jgi:hypothetical protein